MTISKIPSEMCGDWHDRPLRWAVTGPGAELQKFSTKREATTYKRLRRMAGTQAGAIRMFVEAA